MPSDSALYTNFESVQDWPQPNLEPILARVESYFGAKCTEVALMTHGGNHTVTRLTLTSGKEYVARVDYAFEALQKHIRSITFPWKISSEVATMSYIQTHTAIPVPTVYIHDDDLDGTVGGAWMVMDYIPHQTLSQRLTSMTSEQRRSAITSVAEIWSQLLSLRFNAIGSPGIGPDGRIDVGPLVLIILTRTGDTAPPSPKKCGPFTTQRDWLLATARRDMANISQKPLTVSQLHNLATTVSIIQSASALDNVAHDGLLSTIVLEAIDLRPTNILVSNEDPTKIVSIIDWEGTRTCPIWNVAPKFFNGVWDDTIGRQEGIDLDQYFLDEIRRLVPLWAETQDRGKDLRNLARRAGVSTWDPSCYALEV